MGTGVGVTIAGSDLVPRPLGLVRHNRRHLGYRLFVPALRSGRTDGRPWAARPPATRDAAGSAAGPQEAGGGVNIHAEGLGSAGAPGGEGKLVRAAAGGRALAGTIRWFRSPGLCCRSLPRPATAPSSWAWCAARGTLTVPSLVASSRGSTAPFRRT